MSTVWPNEHQVSEIVREIHAMPGRLCLVTTGVGALATYWLFAEPGASRTVLDAQIPYVAAALDEYVGGESAQYVSLAQAKMLANSALVRARSLALRAGLESSTPVIGIGCTGAIATDRERRGENRLHVAWSDGHRERTYSLVLQKGTRDRAGEEAIGSGLLLNAIAESKGGIGRLTLPLLAGESIVESG